MLKNGFPCYAEALSCLCAFPAAERPFPFVCEDAHQVLAQQAEGTA